jgi:kinesin family protein C1
LPSRNPYDYKNRLADLENVIAGMVRTGSTESDGGATGSENAPKVLQENVTKLSEKHAAAATQVAELKEKLQQAEESKAEQLKSLEESKAAALESAENTKQRELSQLRAETEAAAAAQTAQLEKLQSEFDSLKRDAEQLRTQLTSRESELSAMRSTVDTQAANLVAVKAQVDASAAALQAEQAAHAATTARAVSAEETAAAREATIAELEAKAKDDEKLRKKLHNTIQELKGNIRVFARIRPGSQNNAEDSDVQLFDISGSKSLAINDPNGRADSTGEIKARTIDFSYDHVFGPESRQEHVFEEISQLVQSALDGYKVCIFCYGQTGSGKTFTMQGPEGKEALSPGSELAGMIPRSCEQIFATASELSAYKLGN